MRTDPAPLLSVVFNISRSCRFVFRRKGAARRLFTLQSSIPNKVKNRKMRRNHNNILPVRLQIAGGSKEGVLPKIPPIWWTDMAKLVNGKPASLFSGTVQSTK